MVEGVLDSSAVVNGLSTRVSRLGRRVRNAVGGMIFTREEQKIATRDIRFD